jgi:hypothetical protein
MSWKDWLAGAAFVVVLVFAVTAFVLVFHHERAPHPRISQSQENTLQALCYQNPGNGGC